MENKIQLQGIGKVNAYPAKEIKIGTKLMWNYGGVSEVSKIEYSKSGKSMVVTEKYADNKEYKRTLRANRLVAIV